MIRAILTATAFVVAFAGPVAKTALAQTASVQQAAQAKPAGPVSIPVTPERAQAEVLETHRLNEEQARLAADQLAQNEAGRQDYQRELREREATIARQQAEAQAAQDAYEADVARRQAEYEAAMARWRADVAACQAGDVSRCAAAAPK